MWKHRSSFLRFLDRGAGGVVGGFWDGDFWGVGGWVGGGGLGRDGVTQLLLNAMGYLGGFVLYCLGRIHYLYFFFCLVEL